MNLNVLQWLAGVLVFIIAWGLVWLIAEWEDRKFGGGFIPAPPLFTLMAMAGASVFTIAVILWMVFA